MELDALLLLSVGRQSIKIRGDFIREGAGTALSCVHSHRAIMLVTFSSFLH